ncbi:MAG: hypothetical protein Crog4KO_15220 [Crocinitomicaceae bacterium]
MFALKQISFFTVLLFLIAGCGSKNSDDIVKGVEEQLPKVDASEFRKVKEEGITVSILKKMTVNRVSGDVLFSADYLPKEYHIEVSRIPISRFSKDESYQANKSNSLKWFAEQESQKLQDRLSKMEKEPMQQLTSNKKNCFKQTLRGMAFGFPVQKVYFLRYYQDGDAFVTVACWTTHQNAKEFEKLAQYMGMTVSFSP